MPATVGGELLVPHDGMQVCASRSGASDKLDLDFVYNLQTPLNCLPEDAAMFMELRHWKADKKKVGGQPDVEDHKAMPHAADDTQSPWSANLLVPQLPVYQQSLDRQSLPWLHNLHMTTECCL